MNLFYLVAFLFLLNNCTINNTVDEIELNIDMDEEPEEEVVNNAKTKTKVMLHINEIIQQDLLLHPNTGSILAPQTYTV